MYLQELHVSKVLFLYESMTKQNHIMGFLGM